MIAWLLPDVRPPYFGEIAKAIADVVRFLDYDVIIAYRGEDPALETAEAESGMARRVGGLIAASAPCQAFWQVRLVGSLCGTVTGS
jgi:DNA-binding LacI/PurR family transcriptional regulator